MNSGRNNLYRNDGSHILSGDHINPDDDFSCLMSDPMFHAPPLNTLSNPSNHPHHPQHSNYNSHMLTTQMPLISSAPIMTTATNTNEMQHLINSRKRPMSSVAAPITAAHQQNEYSTQVDISDSKKPTKGNEYHCSAGNVAIPFNRFQTNEEQQVVS